MTGLPGFLNASLAPRLTLVLAVAAIAASVACKEEGGVKVTTFSFIGVKNVTDGQLRSVLATTPSSKLPWGEKHYFSREQFQADLKRVEAYYRDVALVHQAWVREPKKSIGDLIKEASAKLGENIQVRRFVRFQMGEE